VTLRDDSSPFPYHRACEVKQNQVIYPRSHTTAWHQMNLTRMDAVLNQELNLTDAQIERQQNDLIQPGQLVYELFFAPPTEEDLLFGNTLFDTPQDLSIQRLLHLGYRQDRKAHRLAACLDVDLSTENKSLSVRTAANNNGLLHELARQNAIVQVGVEILKLSQLDGIIHLPAIARAHREIARLTHRIERIKTRIINEARAEFLAKAAPRAAAFGAVLGVIGSVLGENARFLTPEFTPQPVPTAPQSPESTPVPLIDKAAQTFQSLPRALPHPLAPSPALETPSPADFFRTAIDNFQSGLESSPEAGLTNPAWLETASKYLFWIMSALALQTGAYALWQNFSERTYRQKKHRPTKKQPRERQLPQGIRRLLDQLHTLSTLLDAPEEEKTYQEYAIALKKIQDIRRLLADLPDTEQIYQLIDDALKLLEEQYRQQHPDLADLDIPGDNPVNPDQPADPVKSVDGL